MRILLTPPSERNYQSISSFARRTNSSCIRFVFDNYTWNPDGSDYSSWNGKLIPSRVPLSTMLSGMSCSTFTLRDH